jgi:hypothetical protein
MGCVALAGCAASVSVTPTVGTKTAVCQIRATVHTDGKAEYVPGVLVQDASAPAATVVKYSFDAQYGLNEYNAFVVAVNPLSLVGFPTGSDNMVVTGRIDLLRKETVVRTYAAAASMKRSPTIFGEGETFTDMRRRGLMLVRDNLSIQLCQDQAALTTLLAEPEAATPIPPTTSNSTPQATP